jgi:hypothetical protein
MADKTKEFVKRRKELTGLSALTTTVNKNSPLINLDHQENLVQY